MTPTSKNLVRQLNQQNILQAVFNNGPISRSQISKDLKLNKVTVSDIVETLLESHVLIELGEAEASQRGGRKPMMLQVNFELGYTVAFDIGYKSVDMMVNSLDGSVLNFKRFPARDMAIEERLAWIKTQLHDDTNFPTTEKGLLGVAVALHAVVIDGVVIDSPFIPMGPTTVRDFFAQEVTVPVVIENEANLTAICQSDYADNEELDQVTISIHKGIGAGIMVFGKLYRGINGLAGEVGRTLVYNEDPAAPANCKIEALCSEDAIVDRARTLLGDDKIRREEVLAYAESGNEQILALLERFSKLIAVLVHNVNNTFAPSRIFLNSPLIAGRPQLLDQIRAEVQTLNDHDVQVDLAADVEHAILLGGCALVVHRVLQLSGQRLNFKSAQSI